MWLLGPPSGVFTFCIWIWNQTIFLACQMADVDKLELLDSYVTGNLTESEVLENKPSRDSMQVANWILFKRHNVILLFIWNV